MVGAGGHAGGPGQPRLHPAWSGSDYLCRINASAIPSTTTSPSSLLLPLPPAAPPLLLPLPPPSPVLMLAPPRAPGVPEAPLRQQVMNDTLLPLHLSTVSVAVRVSPTCSNTQGGQAWGQGGVGCWQHTPRRLARS